MPTCPTAECWGTSVWEDPAHVSYSKCAASDDLTNCDDSCFSPSCPHVSAQLLHAEAEEETGSWRAAAARKIPEVSKLHVHKQTGFRVLALSPCPPVLLSSRIMDGPRTSKPATPHRAAASQQVTTGNLKCSEGCREEDGLTSPHNNLKNISCSSFRKLLQKSFKYKLVKTFIWDFIRVWTVVSLWYGHKTCPRCPDMKEKARKDISSTFAVYQRNRTLKLRPRTRNRSRHPKWKLSMLAPKYRRNKWISWSVWVSCLIHEARCFQLLVLLI